MPFYLLYLIASSFTTFDRCTIKATTFTLEMISLKNFSVKSITVSVPCDLPGYMLVPLICKQTVDQVTFLNSEPLQPNNDNSPTRRMIKVCGYEWNNFIFSSKVQLRIFPKQKLQVALF